MILDTQLFWFLNNLVGKSHIFDALVIFLADYLAYFLVAIFLILLFFSGYNKLEKIKIFLITIGSAAIARFGAVELIRLFYHHPRPFMVMHVHQLIPESGWSFPSGHATFFFAIATAIYFYNKKWGVWFFVAAIFMGISRVIAGVHYPSDIIAGAILGVLIAWAIFCLFKKWIFQKPHFN